jgi:hypothetical protein
VTRSTHATRTADTPRARLEGAAMIAAPVLLLVSTIVSLAGGGLTSDRAGGAIQVYAFAAFFLVVAGATRLLETAMPRVGAALYLVGSLGAAAGVAFGLERIATDLTGLRLADQADVAVQLGLLLPGILFPLSMVGIGVALMRARLAGVPGWVGGALATAGVLFPVSRIGEVDALAIVADVILLIALVPLGMAILNRRRAGLPTPDRPRAPVL